MTTSPPLPPGSRRSRSKPRSRASTAPAKFAALAALAALGPGPARADEPAVDTVVIVGGGAGRGAFDMPYAVGTVDAAALRAAGPMVNLSEALARVPGLVVSSRNNYAQDLQISSRGFGARAGFGVRGIRLYTDGIPAAGPDGQGQVSHFDLAGAERIEVLRGPFSALFGSSSGGVISLVGAAPKQRAFSVDGDAGNAGLSQLRFGVALPLDGGFSLRASASAFAIDGFRPHGHAERKLFNLRGGWDGDADQVVVLVNAIDQPAQDPLGLTPSQFAANPWQTAAPATTFDTRKDTRQEQAGVQWRHRFDHAGALRRAAIVAYGGQRAVTQWQSIPVSTQTASATQPGGVIDFRRRYDGLDARLAWGGEAWRAVTGTAVDVQREARRGFENFTGSGSSQLLGVTGKLRRDESNEARTRDVYAQAELDLAPTLSATAGLRHGRLSVSTVDHFLSNGDDSGALAFGYTTPALALRWQPAGTLSLYASAGRGYESPTLAELAYRPDGQPGFNTVLKPQRSRQVELGAKWRGGALAGEVALFRADTDDEIGVKSNTGGRSTYQNVGRTRRQGAELSLRWHINAAWRAQLAATLLDATYRGCADTGCSAALVPGNRIAGTLPRSAFAELAWTPGAWELAIEGRAQGRQPANDTNTVFGPGHGLLALRTGWRQRVADGTLELLGRVDNLAGRAVVGSVIVNEGNQRYFEPDAGRSALLSLRWTQRF